MPFHRFAIPGLASPFHGLASLRSAFPLLCFSRQLHAYPGAASPFHFCPMLFLAFPSHIVSILRLSIADHVIAQPFNAYSPQILAIPSLNSSLLFRLCAILGFSFAFHVISFPSEPPPIHCIANPANPFHCLSLLCLFWAILGYSGLFQRRSEHLLAIPHRSQAPLCHSVPIHCPSLPLYAVAYDAFTSCHSNLPLPSTPI